MQLSRSISIAAVAAAMSIAMPSQARADGTVSVTGAYYKERSTRVAQPMVDLDVDVGAEGSLSAYFLVDAITSASASAGAAGGVAFTETRYEAGGSYLHEFGDFRLGIGGRASTEPDYKSFFGNVRGSFDLADKNATLSLAFAGGHDLVSNEGAQTAMSEPIEGTLNTVLGSVGFSQVLTPTLVASVTYDLTYLTGFLQNAYRQVPAGGVLVAERVPDSRLRNAVFGSVRAFVPRSKTTLVGGYRFYFDDWGVLGHTPEARAIQEIKPNLDVHFRYRYYHQNSADFFRTVYDTADPMLFPHVTSDQKLGEMRNQSFAGKLDAELSHFGATGRWQQARLVFLVEYMLQSTSFGNAFATQLGLVVPLDS